MDFVHLHDMFVMFHEAGRTAAAKPPESRDERECSQPPGVQVIGPRCRIAESADMKRRYQESCMNKLAIRTLTLAVLSTALVAGPVLTAYAAGSDNPSPPASDTKKEKKKGDKSS